MPRCHLCLYNRGTKVWVNRYNYEDKLLTCGTCYPSRSYELYKRYGWDIRKVVPGFHGSEEYPWACTGVSRDNPDQDSFTCFDCRRVAPPQRPGVLYHMAIWMYGNVEMPEEFRFKNFKKDFRKGEFIVCEACGQKRHAERRDGRGTVTEDVAVYNTARSVPDDVA
jgi:hypothetical protein